jgi:hypothetical protein
MSRLTLFAPPAMTTSQLARSVCFANSTTELAEKIVQRNRPLEMSWVVVTDEQGKRELRMRWRVAEADQG